MIDDPSLTGESERQRIEIDELRGQDGTGIFLSQTRWWAHSTEAYGKSERNLKPLRGVDAERQIVALMRPDRAERLAVRTVVEVLRLRAARVQAEFSATEV